MTRVGLFGGTFDPLHVAHLIIAQEAAAALALETVVFIPSKQPPHKSGPSISHPEDRYRLTAAAVEDNPCFGISRIEMERSGPSYTIDTVLEIKQTIPPDSALFLIIGMDSLLDMQTWKDPDKLIREVTLAVAPRPGCPPPAVPDGFHGRTVVLPVPPVDLSSSLIRERVRAGKPIRYLVPPAVEHYIRSKNLYR